MKCIQEINSLPHSCISPLEPRKSTCMFFVAGTGQ